MVVIVMMAMMFMVMVIEYLQTSGQIYPSAFPEMLRVVRPGGYILIAMKVNK